ncbi:MAG TPA: glutathione S-transferase N-terminal domain-containing protein [Alphaproteobacteria bacterium]
MTSAPIDLYTFRTANGRKASIMLEECGLPYAVHVIDITRGDQHAPDFLRINPNGRIPAIVDPDGPDGRPHTVFESGAIMLNLAEKCGKLLPRDTAGKYDAIQWLMLQMGGIGPMFGQAFHFRHQTPGDAPADAIAYGRARYDAEVARLCGVLDRRLAETEYLAGEYSVADVATFPWIAVHRWLEIDLARFPHLGRWYGEVGARPAVRRGMNVPPRA